MSLQWEQMAEVEAQTGAIVGLVWEVALGQRFSKYGLQTQGQNHFHDKTKMLLASFALHICTDGANRGE